MINDQFIWRGNGSLVSPTTQGYPLEGNATWPTARITPALWSTKNLLWLFGGTSGTYTFTDLSTYSDGMVFAFVWNVFLLILFSL